MAHRNRIQEVMAFLRRTYIRQKTRLKRTLSMISFFFFENLYGIVVYNNYHHRWRQYQLEHLEGICFFFHFFSSSSNLTSTHEISILECKF